MTSIDQTAESTGIERDRLAGLLGRRNAEALERFEQLVDPLVLLGDMVDELMQGNRERIVCTLRDRICRKAHPVGICLAPLIDIVADDASRYANCGGTGRHGLGDNRIRTDSRTGANGK